MLVCNGSFHTANALTTHAVSFTLSFLFQIMTVQNDSCIVRYFEETLGYIRAIHVMLL
jgi:hypothetical protein